MLAKVQSMFSFSTDQGASVPEVEVDDALRDRVEGCILGQAIGDALGARYEFRGKDMIKEMIGEEMVDGSLPILGGGHTKVVPGQVTDDTELALALARSMLRHQTYDVTDVANSYVEWLISPAFGIGRTTMNALLDASNIQKSAKKRLEKIVIASNACNKESLSNGCLMRISPLAIAGFTWTPEKLKHAAKVDCFITNPNIMAQDAVAAHVTGLRAALQGQSAQEVYDLVVKSAQDPVIKRHLTMAANAPEPTKLKPMLFTDEEPEIMTDSRQYMGYLGIALQNSYHELLHSTSFEKSLTDIILRGGDTDTNGCIAGALLGAVHGAAGIPTGWKDAVLKCENAKRVGHNPWARQDDICDVAIRLLRTREPRKKNVKFPDITIDAPVYPE